MNFVHMLVLKYDFLLEKATTDDIETILILNNHINKYLAFSVYNSVYNIVYYTTEKDGLWDIIHSDGIEKNTILFNY